MFGMKSKKEEMKTRLADRIKDKVLHKSHGNGHHKSAIAKVDERIRQTISEYSAKPEDEINERLEKLEHEWNAEKMVRTNAAALSILGLTMGLFSNKRWFVLSGLALPFLFKPTTDKWYSPMKPLKIAGVRSSKEIEAEKYALKSLRGDFAR